MQRQSKITSRSKEGGVSLSRQSPYASKQQVSERRTSTDLASRDVIFKRATCSSVNQIDARLLIHGETASHSVRDCCLWNTDWTTF